MLQYIKGIFLDNQWHLLPQPETFTTLTNGICEQNQGHLLTHSKAFASNTKGIRLHH